MKWNNTLALDKQKKAGRTYTWNEKNELSVSADSRYNVNYIYGEGGERTAKVAHSSTGTTSETLYFNKMYSWHYDGAISDYTGNYSKNIFLGETRILTKVNRADTFTSEEYAKQYWYHSDHLGSASLITDYQGREYERIEYTPYGELWVERKTPTDNLDTIFRFSGKELDAETGNYYYGARYLDPRTSRWLSTDPALGEYIPGAPVNDEAKKRNGNLPGMGGVFNVVNFHLYHYAGNNPVKYVDPDGRFTIALGVNTFAGAGTGGQTSSGIVIGVSKKSGLSFGTYTSKGMGSVIGASISVTIAPTADSVFDNAGSAVSIGGSAGEGIAIGGDVSKNINGSGGAISGNVGFSLKGGAEGHVMYTTTEISGTTASDVVNAIDNAIKEFFYKNLVAPILEIE